MKTRLYLGISLSVIISIFYFISSCSKTATPTPTHTLPPVPPTPKPTTCVSGVPDSTYVNQSVTFTSCSSGATSYLWDYGDSSARDTTQIVTHTYTKPGIYRVTFTPSNAGGAGTPKIFNIKVWVGYYTFKGVTTLVEEMYPDGDGFLEAIPNGLQINYGSSTYSTQPLYIKIYRMGILIFIMIVSPHQIVY
jgi:hypothetical protein